MTSHTALTGTSAKSVALSSETAMKDLVHKSQNILAETIK
jgi:hypothetical protein